MIATKNKYASVTFTPKPEDYAVGDTITVGLDNGKKATYTLTEIK